MNNDLSIQPCLHHIAGYTLVLIEDPSRSMHTNNNTESHSSEMSPNEDSWHSRYLEMQQNYRAVKKQNREQSKMSRQLIEAVKNKLLQTDRYIYEVLKHATLKYVVLYILCKSNSLNIKFNTFSTFRNNYLI